MLLTTRYLIGHKGAKDSGDGSATYSIDPKKPIDLLSGSSGLAKIFVPKKEWENVVPTLSAMIEAGDEAVCTSSLFEGLQEGHGKISLNTLLNHFGAHLARRPATERLTYPPAISSFLTSHGHGFRRSLSVKMPRASPKRPPNPKRRSMDLTDRSSPKSLLRKTDLVLVETGNGLVSVNSSSIVSQGPPLPHWVRHVQHLEVNQGKPAISASPDEIQALSVMLGAPLTIISSSEETSKNPPALHADGAYGISISVTPSEAGNVRISFGKSQLSIAQRQSRGSGYSLLFAKHLAHSSLPFSQDFQRVNAILITNDTLSRIKSGTPLHLERSSSNELPILNASFLSRLPTSRPPNFHILSPSTTSSTSTALLLSAISSLPFTGGLVPLASSPLIRTIQFITSGGLPPGRLLQRLDALVDKVHRQAPHLRLFGPLFDDKNVGALYRENRKLGKLATRQPIKEEVADRVARVQRYVTLLQRLMALLVMTREDISGPSEVLQKVAKATNSEIAGAYKEAQKAYCESLFDPTAPAIPPKSKKRASTASCDSTISEGDSEESLESKLSPRRSSTFRVTNSGHLIEKILKADLPLDIQNIAVVARLVLVAWTLCVGVVAWEDGDEGVRLRDLRALGLPEKMVLS